MERILTARFLLALSAFVAACSLSKAQTFTLLSGWPEPNAQVLAMALDQTNGVLYIGGDFTEVSGQPRQRLAAIDIATGALTSWAPAANLAVRAIIARGDSVIVGGSFTEANGQPRMRLAAFHRTTAILSAWAPSANSNVHCLLANATTLYVGGIFTSMAGQPRGMLAAFDANGDLTSWNPSGNAHVYDMQFNGTNILAAGNFTSIGGASRSYFSELDATTGLATAWTANADNSGYALAKIGGRLFAGGNYAAVNGAPRAALSELAATDGSVQTWAPIIGGGGLQALAADGNMVAAGGFFGAVNGAPHFNLAVLDATTGTLLAGSPSVSATVTELIANDGRLFAAGAFTTADGQPRVRLAVWSYCTQLAWFADADDDGLGDNGAMTMACEAPVGHVADNTDCDDTDDQIGAAVLWYQDLDGDENGDHNVSVLACEQPLGFEDNDWDCDDTNPAIAADNACNDGNPYTTADVLTAWPACGCQGTSVILAARALLEGPYDPLSGMMHDDLRVAGLIPLQEPYTALGYEPGIDSPPGGDTMDPSVLLTTGSNAIVDWIILEFRAPFNGALALSTRFALLQRDGDIVESDGVSPVRFPLQENFYRLAVLHRNHMGVVEAEVAFTGGGYYSNTSRDLSSAAFITHFGPTDRRQVGGAWLLRAGDTSFNDDVMYIGFGNDRDPLLVSVGGSLPTNVISGYHTGDINMDGLVKYVGSNNDRDVILVTVGGSTPYNVRMNTYLRYTF